MYTSDLNLDAVEPPKPSTGRGSKPPPVPRRRQFVPLGTWFSPNMEGQEATAVLKTATRGFFLVRRHETVQGSFVLSASLGGEKVAHVDIHGLKLRVWRFLLLAVAVEECGGGWEVGWGKGKQGCVSKHRQAEAQVQTQKQAQTQAQAQTQTQTQTQTHTCSHTHIHTHACARARLTCRQGQGGR